MHDRFELYQKLSIQTPSKILLLVMDGLGGLPDPALGRSEMEVAETPHLDALAAEGVTGLSTPVAPGITPGSGPSHLSLFGYDPFRFEVGRGVLSALGIDFELQGGDVAARVNFCTVGPDGRIEDRRAGRIPTEECARLCALLATIRLPGVEVFLLPEMDYRAALVLRGRELDGRLNDSDPQREGFLPLPVEPRAPEAARTAQLVNQFIDEARRILQAERPANMLLVRGFDQHRGFPSLGEIFKLRPACIATYPMYRGLARLVGMKVLATGTTLEDEAATLESEWNEHDFFFFHVKKTDSAGEDGNFRQKVEVLESVDRIVPRLRALEPDVIAVSGDHSTPSVLKGHSWHPLPVLLWSPHCGPDEVRQFHERACSRGGLGVIHHTDILPLLMANALKFLKYGA